MKKKKKESKVTLLEPEMVPYWRFRTTDGEIAIYIPNGIPLTIERANYLLDMAKQDLLKDAIK